MRPVPTQLPIAIVGIGCVFPGSDSPAGFWRDIAQARDRMSEVPEFHWLIEDYYDPDPKKPDMTYSKRGGFLSPMEFNPLEFGIPPGTLPATDSTQLLSLIVARNVLDDLAAGRPLKIDRERTSVILGCTGATEMVSLLSSRLQRPIWAKALREAGIAQPEIERICDRIAEHFTPWQGASFPGLLGNVIAGRIANRLDFHGSNLITDAACASSLAAVHAAVNRLVLEESDLVITGGVDANNDIVTYMCFSKARALSPSGDCRPFSNRADGAMIGEGIGMLALKRLADAERDEDRIYAVIRGIGSASDGRSKSIYAPRSDGQARALRRAYQRAGYSPNTVELLEAHGTGTPAGDVAEAEALRAVFDPPADSGSPYCALGSIKSQIGHTKAASGSAGLIKAAMALHQKVLPPTIKVEVPDPELKLDRSAFYLNTAARPWIRGDLHPRRASVSAFGFGGTNYHLTLEEYRAASQSSLRTSRTELFVSGAGSAAELAEKLQVAEIAPGDLPAAAQAGQRTFDPAAKIRVAIVAESREDLASKLREAAAHLASSSGNSAAESHAAPSGIYIDSSPKRADGIAFLFPGQGSQYVGMGADLAMAHATVRGLWDRCADMRFDGIAIHEKVFPPPVFEDEARRKLDAGLRATEWAQPALGLATMAAFALIEKLGIRPACFIGHSFGELSALCAAGSFRIEELLRLARIRGELMREAARANPGGMLALAASAERVSSLLSRAGSDAVPVNFNAPDETVVSGGLEALERIEELCSREQIATRRLPVAAAFHSPLVGPAADSFAAALQTAEVQAPALDVLGNTHADVYPRDPEEIRRRLSEQLTGPVRFADQIEAAYRQGVRIFLELGPGSMLSDLTRRILKGRPHLAVSIDRKSRDGVTSFHHAIGQLATAGISVDFEALWENYQAPALLVKKPGSTVTLTGTSYGKPYPANAKERVAAGRPPRPTPPLAPIPAITAVGSGEDSVNGWIQAYQEIQRTTADTHATFSRTMAELHESFLSTMKTSLAQLTALQGNGVPLELSAPEAIRVAAPEHAPPADLAALVVNIVAEKTGYEAGMLNPAMDLEADLGIDSIKRVEILAALRDALPSLPDVPPADMAAIRTPGDVVRYLQQDSASALERAAEPAAPAAPKIDLPELLLGIVAEKTGYEAPTLNMQMDLEADLGIDSIKRVEILAALRDAVPSLPDVTPHELASIRTLGDVVARLTQTMQAQPVAPAMHEEPAVERLMPRMEPEEAVGLSMAGLRGGRVVITPDGTGIAEALVEALASDGVRAEIVTEVPPDADAVLFLGGMRRVVSIDDAIEVNREVFRAARAVAERFTSRAGIFVGVQDTGGDFGLSVRDPLKAWTGGIAGLVRTLRHEWTAAQVKVIDCERGARSAAELARAIAAELFLGGDTCEVGLCADGSRRVPRMVPPAAEEAARIPIEPGAVVVASGGGRGITARCLVELARASQPHLILLGRTEPVPEPGCCANLSQPTELTRALLSEAREDGRTPAPAEIGRQVRDILASREVRQTLREIEHAGATAEYLCVDVRDASAVEAALRDVRARCGPIQGLVHGAGVIADKLLAAKTDAQFDLVFDTKVKGLRALLDATREDRLQWICLFSSIVAKTGNAGQSDYAMANEILNLAACAEKTRRGSDCAVHSLGWGPWGGGMVTPALRDHFSAIGVPLIPPDAGAHAFVAASGSSDVSSLIAPGSGADSFSLSRREAAFDIRVDQATYPCLKDHAVNGVPIVPVALVIEWFLRAMRGVSRERKPVLRSLKVLRGIKLDPALGGEFLRITRRYVDGAWKLELRDSSGAFFYSAIADFEVSSTATPIVEPARGPVSEDRIYDGTLFFHGPAFQALRSLEPAGDGSGMSADLAGLIALGWHSGVWQTDPAAVDGMLQVGARWSGDVLGGATLPMGFQSFHVFEGGPAQGPLRATARTRQVLNSRVICDIALATHAGALVAALSGAEFVLRPDLTRPAAATA